MACACQKGKKQFDVVADNGNGKVLFTSSNQQTANAVSRRYPGSIVRDRSREAAAKAEEQPTT